MFDGGSNQDSDNPFPPGTTLKIQHTGLPEIFWRRLEVGKPLLLYDLSHTNISYYWLLAIPKLVAIITSDTDISLLSVASSTNISILIATVVDQY